MIETAIGEYAFFLQLLEPSAFGSTLWETGVQENVPSVGSQQSHDSSVGIVHSETT
jgi:hypothetical protein